ncbi:hypothetical protein LTR62_005679 [Meristemomyces frigidus]|uniref:Zn(2)-C6 fungal-type domain-containing protein n=1 Tax=Meristemomyces frigidus TaxID=1508187 RepID=A0AAN7TE89_9PEZI|nr:hypothetical protein LTR62_005679 [Meristemomyces frigidus]
MSPDEHQLQPLHHQQQQHQHYQPHPGPPPPPILTSAALKRAADGPPLAELLRLSPAPSQNGSNKARKTNSTRTGQACDRCKVRKIRCDARVGGCSPCLQNNTECKTTDRITGRTTSRGHTESVESENVELKMYVMELQQQLKNNGVEPSAPPLGPAPSYAQPSPAFGAQWSSPRHASGFQSGSQPVERHHSASGSLLPEFRSGCIGDNYLGVASENNWLSTKEGTSIALFGTKIDLADFMPPEPNAEATAMSYQTFLGYAFGGQRLQAIPELPEYGQCRQYAEWYFRTIQCFVPVLHKPDFMYLLRRIYQDAYQPTPAETVMVHMMLTIMYFQYSARNESTETRQMSFEHFHYSLTFIPQLLTSHCLEDIQALALICSQLRNMPRPGASWFFTNTVLGVAIEAGLHRSAKAWPNNTSNLDPHTSEMRKRIFWTLMLFHINSSGNYGRPMPLRFEDFDIEVPEIVNDCLPEEEHTLREWKKCSFRAGIEGFKLLKVLLSVYQIIYAVNPPPDSQYEATVSQLTQDLEAFLAQLPPELASGPLSIEEDRISALYLELGAAEYLLLLHHPALCRSSSPQVYSHNLDVCLEASNKLMIVANKLKQLKSLDTTLFYATTFLAAICTTIFGFNERKDQLTTTDVQRLRKDMDTWLDVLGQVGKMLGTGFRLQQFVGGIIDRHVGEISRFVAQQTAVRQATAAAAVVAASNASAGAESAQKQQSDFGDSNQSNVIAKYEQPPSDYYTTPYTTFTPAPQTLSASNINSQLLQVPSPSTAVDPMAWRHFADNLVTGVGVPVHSPVGGNVVSGGGYLSPQGLGSLQQPALAAFGSMSVPDSNQAWPMVQFSTLPGSGNGGQ